MRRFSAAVLAAALWLVAVPAAAQQSTLTLMTHDSFYLPDGVIEAFRIDGAKTFALAVQWHPEWKVMENPFSRALFAEFGKAGREHASRRPR